MTHLLPAVPSSLLTQQPDAQTPTVTVYHIAVLWLSWQPADNIVEGVRQRLFVLVECRVNVWWRSVKNKDIKHTCVLCLCDRLIASVNGRNNEFIMLTTYSSIFTRTSHSIWLNEGKLWRLLFEIKSLFIDLYIYLYICCLIYFRIYFIDIFILVVYLRLSIIFLHFAD